jgi:hypothetical protein
MWTERTTEEKVCRILGLIFLETTRGKQQELEEEIYKEFQELEAAEMKNRMDRRKRKIEEFLRSLAEEDHLWEQQRQARKELQWNKRKNTMAENLTEREEKEGENERKNERE